MFNTIRILSQKSLNPIKSKIPIIKKEPLVQDFGLWGIVIITLVSSCLFAWQIRPTNTTTATSNTTGLQEVPSDETFYMDLNNDISPSKNTPEIKEMSVITWEIDP